MIRWFICIPGILSSQEYWHLYRIRFIFCGPTNLIYIYNRIVLYRLYICCIFLPLSSWHLFRASLTTPTPPPPPGVLYEMWSTFDLPRSVQYRRNRVRGLRGPRGNPEWSSDEGSRPQLTSTHPQVGVHTYASHRYIGPAHYLPLTNLVLFSSQVPARPPTTLLAPPPPPPY